MRGGRERTKQEDAVDLSRARRGEVVAAAERADRDGGALTCPQKPMEKANHGTIALIGSVAGDRGRKSNYVYGAAKGLVTRYAQGLQHRFAGTGVKVVLIKPGPTDTPMTAHLKGRGAKLAPVEGVAKQIVDAVESGKPVIYAPGKWRLIMMVVRHLPAFVFNKIDI